MVRWRAASCDVAERAWLAARLSDYCRLPTCQFAERNERAAKWLHHPGITHTSRKTAHQWYISDEYEKREKARERETHNVLCLGDSQLFFPETRPRSAMAQQHFQLLMICFVWRSHFEIENSREAINAQFITKVAFGKEATGSAVVKPDFYPLYVLFLL